MMRRFLGLYTATLFLLGMVTLTGPDVFVRRCWNVLRRASAKARRKTEVAWQLAWARRYLRMVEFVMGMSLDIRTPDLWWIGNYIIVINHRNVLDHLVAAEVIHTLGVRDPRWIIKEQMRGAPIIGGSLSRAAFAFVSRNKDPEDLDRIRLMAQIARADDVSVCLYPEGTRFDGKSKPDSRYTMVREPKVGGFATLCEALPDYKVLVICIDWGDLKDARTIWDGSAYVGRHVMVTVWDEENPGVAGAQELLTDIWDRMNHKLSESFGRILALKMQARALDRVRHGRQH